MKCLGCGKIKANNSKKYCHTCSQRIRWSGDPTKKKRVSYTSCITCGKEKTQSYAPRCKSCRSKLFNSMAGKKHEDKSKFRKYEECSNINYSDFVFTPSGVKKFRQSCCNCGEDRGYHQTSERKRLCKKCYLEKNKSSYSKEKKRLRNAMKSNLRERLRKRLINKNRKSTFDILGYTVDDLKAHLENKFKEGMSWDNYGHFKDGRMGWQIDHIIPDSKFNYESVLDPEFLECWSLSNLQPLWGKENLSKKDKIGGVYE